MEELNNSTKISGIFTNFKVLPSSDMKTVVEELERLKEQKQKDEETEKFNNLTSAERNAERRK